ncbi:MAG: hypothetical protein UU28_C0023G0002 [Parcubacteria group bacterium GW2011_GWD2_40_9]|nr:MAG: hypothetical protein UU28_C0023G0002 [Parcubacteria group bacterium GW2011_GWD2_40_9]
MKILFFLHRNFARFGHALAVNLKEKHLVENFSAYAHLRLAKEILESQNDIKYEPLLLDEDIHEKYKKEKIDYEFLKKLENDYGLPNLWPHITIDRTLMYSILPREYPSDKPMYSHEDMLRILQVKAKTIIKLLEETKPDYIFLSFIGATSSMLLYHLARKMGVKTILIYLPGIKNLLSLTEDYNRLTFSEKIFERIQCGDYKSPRADEARKIIDEFRKKPATYHTMNKPQKNIVHRFKQIKFILPGNLWKNLIFLSQMVFKKRDYSEERLDWFLIDRVKRKFRSIIGYNDIFENPKDNEDFCFFPLNAEPEITLYLYAPFHLNQPEIARQIARSLPVGFKLYVKDHPIMYGYRTRRFYKELKKIPNVKIINSQISGYDLIKKAKIVTTISGTAGWEATVLKKPVITFGDVFYNKLSIIKNCKTPERLPYLIKEQLETFKHNEEELVNFLSAILEESVNVDFLDLWLTERNFEKIKNDTGTKKLASLIANKIGLNKQTL